MSNVDYSRYAKINNGVVEEVVETPVEPVETVAEEPINERFVTGTTIEPVEESEPEETPDPIIKPAEPKIGRVYNCEKLNVRQAPDGTAPVVCELFRNAEVEIHEFGSTDDFYMVYTTSGITGFCMKKYILKK